MPVNNAADMIQYGIPEGMPHRALKRASRLEYLEDKWKNMGRDAFTTVLSALYGKLLTVMGIAFPMSEVISTHIPHSFYEVFYLYLYIGSMLFLFYIYVMLVGTRSNKPAVQNNDFTTELDRTEWEVVNETNAQIQQDTDNVSQCNSEMKTESFGSKQQFSIQIDLEKNIGSNISLHPAKIQPAQHFGSFYLRMGAVCFGIGSMIYSGLEIGQYFELKYNTKCHNVLVAVTPATRMAFIFIQMYFIFLNEEQQVKVMKHFVFSRFGLMHMIGTNLSVWLNVLIQETKHEILTFYNPENNTIEFNMATHPYFKSLHVNSNASSADNNKAPSNSHHIVARSIMGPHYIYDCRRTNIIGSLVQNASPFLFPCTIEYSLICAATLYVMWKNIGANNQLEEEANATGNEDDTVNQPQPDRRPYYRRSPHHYSVDCDQAHKGLFVGILFLVLTIISLILFFVLVSRPELVGFAVMEVNICELALYTLSTAASIVGMIQVRKLKFDQTRGLELDNILLLGAQTGVFVYGIFTIIGGHFTKEKNTTLVLITASASLIQTISQTVFILDASKRYCVTLGQMRNKPGREIVTYLLVSNLAMWAINTLEKSRADSHPIQLHFYGLWAWTIITHVSMPLAIFYRFHSTVCLCEIWKKAYKTKHLLYL